MATNKKIGKLWSIHTVKYCSAIVKTTVACSNMAASHKHNVERLNQVKSWQSSPIVSEVRELLPLGMRKELWLGKARVLLGCWPWVVFCFLVWMVVPRVSSLCVITYPAVPRVYFPVYVCVVLQLGSYFKNR